MNEPDELPAKALEDRGHHRIPASYWSHGQPLYVRGIEDLTLNLSNTPQFVLELLDALFVSVFIKRATKEEIAPGTFARRFTYLNLSARERKEWNAYDVPGLPDSAAFEGGENNPLYDAMFKQETATLASRRSQDNTLEWQPTPKFWRRSKTRELPIFAEGNDDEPIGFCAIAEEIDFEMFSFIQSWLQKVFNHEYTNLALGVKGDLDEAQEFLDEIASLRQNLGAIDDVAQKAILIKGNLSNAWKRLVLYGSYAESLYGSFSKDSHDLSETCGQIAAHIARTFKLAPFQPVIELDPCVEGTRIRRSAAIVGTILALIVNADKHSADKTALIRVTAEETEDRVVWKISNRCDRLKGRLILRTFEDIGEVTPKLKNLTGVIIGEILSRAYPATVTGEKDKFSLIFEFPEECREGWLEVKVLSPKEKSS